MAISLAFTAWPLLAASATITAMPKCFKSAELLSCRDDQYPYSDLWRADARGVAGACRPAYRQLSSQSAQGCAQDPHLSHSAQGRSEGEQRPDQARVQAAGR